MAQIIHTQYFQKQLPKGVSISTTSYRDHQFPKHFHDHYTIQLIEEGVNEGFTESVKYKVGQNGLLVINPGELHAGNSLNHEYLKFHTIRLDQSFIHSFHEKNEIPRKGDFHFDIQPIYCAQITHMMNSLIASLRHNNHLRFESNLTGILITLTSNHQKSPGTQSKIPLRLAQDFLHEHYNKNLTLNQIAEVCHLSPYHFLRQFKKQFGIAPFQYLRNIRVEKAKALLPHHPISQAAHQVGFYDHSHFLKSFKKIEGVAPSKQITKQA
ncbi:AraC-type DNA-binding protein [Reichenbachiella faecimaris]|uniref:AraC-type DNA-binding protein n=1 Tax=Reichenbachiella faecimaris TaxID=692418 RepID=A0A1W2GKC6_REIFA|nr:AraC family transcriptional regulator [Reichenbachiella faecimaris]SMD36716.1 AraC-type DNA-binding protein [Reichenbachiella faecimaris]